MPRYTDVDKLIEKANQDGAYGYVSAQEIDNQPTADVVEVVRCKDCKHKEREQPGMVYCPMIVGSWVAGDHFCKWGERQGSTDRDMDAYYEAMDIVQEIQER